MKRSEVHPGWKRGNVTPLSRWKKGDLGNYRPTNLTSVLDKIVEQILLMALLRHMEHRDEVIGGNQHDFIRASHA